MYDDEAFVLCACVPLAVVILMMWYAPLLRVKPLVCPGRLRLPLVLVPFACIAGLFIVTHSYADPQVTASPIYQVLFIAAGITWFAVPEFLLPLLGISLRGDAIENRNIGAILICCSGLIATSFVYAAANIGAGPTIWTTLGPAALGSTMLILAWVAQRCMSPAWENVAIGRDTASAVRLAAFMLATAIVLAPAVAGEWVSIEATLHDSLRRVLPLVGLIAVTAVLDRTLKPLAELPKPPVIAYGIIPAAGFVTTALLIAKWWW